MKKFAVSTILFLNTFLLVQASTVYAETNTNNSAVKSVWHFTPADVNALHSKPADYRIHYGNDPLQFGDLRLPSGQVPYPVVIVIHGGCWISTFADL